MNSDPLTYSQKDVRRDRYALLENLLDRNNFMLWNWCCRTSSADQSNHASRVQQSDSVGGSEHDSGEYISSEKWFVNHSLTIAPLPSPGYDRQKTADVFCGQLTRDFLLVPRHGLHGIPVRVVRK